jgi:hypothetical protein
MTFHPQGDARAPPVKSSRCTRHVGGRDGRVSTNVWSRISSVASVARTVSNVTPSADS